MFAAVGLGAVGCCTLLLYCVALTDAASATTSMEGDMSSVNGFMRDVLDGVRKRVNDRDDDVFADGFNEATSICVGILSKNIDDLLNQIKSGSYLSDQEQFLLSRLTEMKSETEKCLRDYGGSTATGEGR
ncbi:hypothetical protein F4553_005274 [Allocatelliglobosispora scoriae]|uniref:Uncharacterized protein n=1 Tax=Allocatelliglobosispora scoriae TaxID=643052 RepID=A0A841BW45_9ACTN|nr:hypothetical protein [Allocatelliglobosispora scoriae]MBB5871895.1 hypothetical protein [Allocatelliglobosispora scoriae]